MNTMSSTNDRIGFIAFRLTSVYLLIRALDILSSLGMFLANTRGQSRSTLDSEVLIVTYLIWFGLYLLAAVVFYKQAKKFAIFFLTGENDEEFERSDTNEEYLERLAYTIVGVFILATTIPHLSRIIYSVFYSQTHSQALTLELVTAIASIIIGLFLVFEAKTLQSIIRKARGL